MKSEKVMSAVKRGWPIMVMLILASFWVMDMVGPNRTEPEETPIRVYATDPNSGVVSISPTEASYPGEIIEVDINIDPSDSIAGAQFDLAFNPALVTVDSIQEGNLLNQDGANTYFNPGTTDNHAGTIDGVAGVIITPGQTVSTAGVLATITMTAKTSEGTGSLIMSNVVLGNVSGQPVSISVVNGGAEAPNQPPVLGSIGNKTVTQGQTLQFTVTASDPEGDNLSYTVSNLPIGALFYTTNQTFSWTPSTPGVYSNIHFQVSDGQLIDSEDITIVVTAAENNSSGGSSGGGGGAAAVASVTPASNPTPQSSSAPQPIEPPPAPVTVTSVDNISEIVTVELLNDVNGSVTETTEQNSVNGNWQLIIPKGTKNLTEEGEPLERITVAEIESPSTQPEDSSVIGAVCDFGPDGATFEPPITLSLSYDDSELPDNIDEENLTIATWDNVLNDWIYLDSSVDPVSNVITSQIGHFSIYTILSPKAVEVPSAGNVSVTTTTTVSDNSTNVTDETVIEDTETAVVNWAILGWIIAIAVGLSSIAVFAVVLRRRRLLNEFNEC